MSESRLVVLCMVLLGMAVFYFALSYPAIGGAAADYSRFALPPARP